MIEVALNNIEKYFGANKVLHNITFDVKTGERVGLIGQNGTGKTTIFKIIAGLENYDGGTLAIRKGCSIGYLDQIPLYSKENTVEDVLNTAFEDLFELKREMKRLEIEMSKPNNQKLDMMLVKYGGLQQKFEHMGGYEIEEKISKISNGLKIDERLKKRSFDILSGGEKTTIMLGKILLQSPDILLLDEPSNHLDLESIEWLEEFLSEYKGTVIVISHDRYFLDKVITRIVEVEKGEINTYHGNYSYYMMEKERRLFEQLEAYKSQQKKMKNMEDAIKRFRDWGARADNPKMFIKARNMEKRIEKMDKVEKPILENSKIQLEFANQGRSGKEVISIKGLNKSFGKNPILYGLDFHVRYGEKVAILGKNGSGKSTLLKIILNQCTKDSGELILGSRVKIGYLEQMIEFENEEQTILEAFRNSFIVTEGEARSKLSKFLFYKDDVFKKVGNLSGGEKSRLKLCLLMHKDINLLILDEPTNHLDIESREMLESALSEFDGTIVFISHDRYFINKIAQRIAELRNKKLDNYIGNYEYYKSKKIEEKINIEKNITKEEKSKVKKPRKEIKANDSKYSEKQLTKIESEINNLEKQIEEKSRKMDNHSNDYEKLNEIYKEKTELQAELDILLEKWIKLNDKT